MLPGNGRVGFESILGGIYGPMLLRDLNVFDDCEPEEVDDWSPEASCSQCSFCNLPLDKLSDQVPAATSPLSSPSDYSPCQAPSISESSQSAHRFLQAVFNKKDVPLGCDSNIPLVAQELMKKMVHQFAMDYASKCLIHTSTNGVRTKTSSPLSETSDAPLDLTVCRTQEEKECEPELDGVLDLSNRNPASSATSSSSSSSSSNIKVSGRKRRQKEEYIERSWELSEGLLSKALKDIRSGRLQEQRASLLYGIPLHTLKQGLDGWAERRLGMLHQLAPGSKDFRDEVTSCNMMSSMLGGEARLVLQKVAAWAERAEIGGAAEENGDLSFPSSSLTFSQPSGLQKTLTRAFPQLRDALQPPPSPTPSPEPPTPLRIPQIRSMSDHNRSTQAENCSVAENLHQRTSSTEGAASSSTPAARPSSLFKLRPPFLAHGCPGSANQSPHRLGPRSSSLDDSEEGAGSRDKDKQPRKKRGRYRQYDHDLLEEAITMVMAGRMSVSKAQGVYGVPHSTLEYKVKERTGTLKNPPKKKSANFCSSNSSSSGSVIIKSRFCGYHNKLNSYTTECNTFIVSDLSSSMLPSFTEELGNLVQQGKNCRESSALDAVLSTLCLAHRTLLYQILKVENKIERGVVDMDPPCPILKREQSPSPPPLSPIPSDISKKTDEKPPSLLHHRQEEETNIIVKHDLVNARNHNADVDTVTEDECKTQKSQAEQNPSGTLLQDVVNRFSEKLETIKPLEKDPPPVSTAINVSENQELLSPSADLQFHADAHLTEIITKVLHKGNGSDYNLSELFNRHDSKEPKSPNTRSRRRQEVLAAIATPADDSSARRHTLQIKREFALLDQSCNRRRGPSAKRTRLNDGKDTANTSCTSTDSNLAKGESKREMEGVEPVENHKVEERPLKMLSVESGKNEIKDEIQTVIVTEDIKAEEKEWEISNEEKDLIHTGTQIPTPELQSKSGKQSSKGYGRQKETEITVAVTSAKQCNRPCKEGGEVSIPGSDKNYEEAPSSQCSNSENRPGMGKDCHSPIRKRQKCQSNHSKEARRTRRNIVPPQRFSSYVTEPRKMFFVACFSDSIFNQRTQKEKVLTYGTLDALSKDPESNDTQLESRNDTTLSTSEHTGKIALQSTQRERCGPSYPESETMAAKEKSPAKCNLDIRTDGSDCAAKPIGRLRSSPQRLQVSKPDSRMPQNSSNRNVTVKSAPCVKKPPNFLVEYTSPIKLMFVSAVKDKEGVRYSLKSASCGSSSQAEQPFDPCEVSSWSGTPEKPKGQSTESRTSKVKSFSSPLKSTTSPARSAGSPSKSASSPVKSASSTPKSASPRIKSVSSPSKSASSPVKSASSTPKSASPRSKSVSSPSKLSSSPVKSASSTPKSASPRSKSVSSPSKSASSPVKSASLTPKSASPRSKSVSSPSKSASSPVKSASTTPKTASPLSKSTSSPKSVSSSPKIGSRRSGESTPTKRLAGTESQRSPCDLISFHESTPPKRRPGRPKKLGPQLEQKVKRPIGRPRKQKVVDLTIGTEISGKSVTVSDAEENVNKNLKITVVYGRSRRNKRMVSEGFDQLQTEFHDAWQAVGLKSDLGILMHNSKTSSGNIETTSTELSEELNFVSPVKESAPLSSRNIKCQKGDDSVPSRKPGRPAKVKISGISVTVTSVSPRQRKIQINRDTRQSPETQIHKQGLLSEFQFAKEPRTISYQSANRSSQTEKGIETKKESKDRLHNPVVAVRHSMRVRKPSIHFLHAVATSTSRSYSHSNALLRRSKQLLLNKASNERRKEEQQSSAEASGGKRQLFGQDKRNNISQDLSRVAGVSVDSIFTPKETLRWWAASTEEKTTNQELARRIRLISDTWVSGTVENQEKEMAFNSKLGTKCNNSFTRKSKHSSVVRTLFDCPPNTPRSCSMQQLCSWFMQTTETQSLAIVKKPSSRNPYEPGHFPRSANSKSVCHSPQAERLRKHIKKFAKTVPKSPLQHRQAQRRLGKRNNAPLPTHIRRRLFTPRFATGRFNQGGQWWQSRAFGNYQATVLRARTRFLTREERERWRKRQRNKKTLKAVTSCSNGHAVRGQQQRCKALHRSAKDQLSDCLENSSASSSLDQTQEPVDVPKEQNLCSKAWSPETLKECRVFLRKINSPDNESTEEEWDSCTVTLDDGSPSAYLFAGRERELVGVVKAVKTERISMNGRTAPREPAGSAPQSLQEQDEMPEGRQRGKYKSPGVVSTEPPQPPPAKTLRQSRMKGLTGPRWCDFVLEN
ncbi:putative ligand-dependent nuclear receptor corepressor-like protein [Scophthalmus maximus]|uniref:Putative ligand-dependent nuclear receptor corepressor-like protein n=1 Tax=Scophthalmus maximus TaxID=52904 RepID=A0A2U9BP24_SCOMX|nr:putative ligand-dependent nuclear receptor corepressor-like protein [Scophthalmus maximus]